MQYYKIKKYYFAEENDGKALSVHLDENEPRIGYESALTTYEIKKQYSTYVIQITPEEFFDAHLKTMERLTKVYLLQYSYFNNPNYG